MNTVKNILKLIVFSAIAVESINAAMVPSGATSLGFVNTSISQQNLISPIYAKDELMEMNDSEIVDIWVQVTDLAQSQGLGQKTANLVVLDQVAKDDSISSELAQNGFTVAVPEFVGISSKSVQNLIYNSGFDINSEWQNIIENSGINADVIRESLEKQTLPEKFILDLKVFAAGLRTD